MASRQYFEENPSGPTRPPFGFVDQIRIQVDENEDLDHPTEPPIMSYGMRVDDLLEDLGGTDAVMILHPLRNCERPSKERCPRFRRTVLFFKNYGRPPRQVRRYKYRARRAHVAPSSR
jgi:hypothetical protein